MSLRGIVRIVIYLNYGCELDAYVGSRIAVSEGTGITERNTTESDVRHTVLLLRRRVQEQYKPSESKGTEGFSDIANTLQQKTWDQTFLLSKVR